MDNDGRFPDESQVLVRYPMGVMTEEHPRDQWPWLPGTVLEQTAHDRWHIRVDAPELAEATDEDERRPLCFRTPSEIRKPGDDG